MFKTLTEIWNFDHNVNILTKMFGILVKMLEILTKIYAISTEMLEILT